MDLTKAVAFARSRSQGVLVTIRRDGRPQLSNILYTMGADGATQISVTENRAKAQNLRRDPRGQLYVAGDSFWEYVVLDGTARLTPAAERPDDDVVEALVELYRAIKGEDHPDWEEYRRTMVQERRMVVTLRPNSAIGLLGA